MFKKANEKMIKAMIKTQAFLREERGDTNFISILVLLGIALALAGVFIGFKDSVMSWVEEQIPSFFTEK